MRHVFFHPLERHWLAAAIALCSVAMGTTARGQLTWAAGGNGGSGTWDNTAGNTVWFNGSTNVPWTDGSSAVFAGVGGTVTSTFPGPAVNDITFNAPGYTIQGGWINAPNSTFTITTNQAATFGSTLSANVINATLVKNGTAPLIMSGTNFMDNVQVNAGEYVASGSSTLFFSKVTLADTAGVVLTLAPTSTDADVQSLSGGGASGGTLQPNNVARTVTVTLWDTGTFRGVAQDNGSGKLAVTVFTASKTVTLAGTNTYSGATTVSSGTLVFSENGSAALSSAVSVSVGGTLRLDNSVTAIANRLSDSADVTMENGRFEFVGNSSTAIEEQLGALKFSGAVSINNTQPGTAATLLTFAGATRQAHATIDFTGSGRTKWNGMANDSAGIVGAYATAGNEWATVGGDGRVDALATYASDINSAASGDHVKIVGGGSTSLATSATRATLNLQNSSGGAGALDLGSSNTLTLSEGGLLSSGTATNRIQSGTLRAGGSEMIVTNRNALTIDSSVGESVAGTDLTKNGEGSLTLTGTNSYSGKTVIEQGTLVVSSDANLGAGSTVQFNGGKLVAAQSFTSTKGLSNGTPLVGTIDTAGHNVAFAGPNTGAISKIGAGTLTLSNPAAGSVFVNQGTVALTNPTSGDVSLEGGTLLASGTISSLQLSSASTLDIGGSSAATLTTTSYFLDPGPTTPPLTVRFGLGISGSDLWKIGTPFSGFGLGPSEILFDFQNLGGVTTGTAYTLMQDASFSSLVPQMFAIAPSAAAAGWHGTFSVNASSVQVTFSSTPEPGSTALFIAGALFLTNRRRTRRG